jgi:hypothetical protein
MRRAQLGITLSAPASPKSSRKAAGTSWAAKSSKIPLRTRWRPTDLGVSNQVFGGQLITYDSRPRFLADLSAGFIVGFGDQRGGYFL